MPATTMPVTMSRARLVLLCLLCVRCARALTPSVARQAIDFPADIVLSRDVAEPEFNRSAVRTCTVNRAHPGCSKICLDVWRCMDTCVRGVAWVGESMTSPWLAVLHSRRARLLAPHTRLCGRHGGRELRQDARHVAQRLRRGLPHGRGHERHGARDQRAGHHRWHQYRCGQSPAHTSHAHSRSTRARRGQAALHHRGATQDESVGPVGNPLPAPAVVRA